MNRRSRLWLTLLLLAASVTGRAALTVEELARQPELWPAQVTLTASAKATVLKDGKPAGIRLLGAGKTLVVAGVSAEGVTGRTTDALVLVPLDKTDLLAQVGRAHPEHATDGQRESAAQSAAMKQLLDGAVEKARAARAAPAPAAPVATAPPAWAGQASPVQKLLAGRLVRLDSGTLKPFDAGQLGGVKYYGVMFSAGWCPPCRAFAPQLLDHYRRLRAEFPEFELVLVSRDRSPAAMLDYMREEAMPWPALRHGQAEKVPAIDRLAGPGIPCLVLIDAEGRVLADSFRGDDYLGPASVLEAAWRILRKQRG
ncbi:MAG: hypothetical protein JNG83_13505 [Opitutaceae bacterium]|nr:hypothetical protein [Opitutaceae bacterium]